MINKYKPVIGLEIHVELKTKSKMFCQCKANYFGKPPNSNTCPVCLGLPGALPVPNKKAVEWTMLIGKALNCKINKISKFDRKHYFYPDLPKGYQISQYDEPLAKQGKFEIRNSKFEIEKLIGITRVHLEEDTGKLLHIGNDTLVDFNRSGVPLVEIVTEPDFDSSDDVKRFLEELQVIIRYLDVSDADMEKGSMRLEPNISVKHVTYSMKHKRDELPNYKVEVKNINSFRFVKQAIEFEVERQTDLLEKGITPKQETRGFDEKKGMTYSQRSKEEAHDYRYFPEPDIPPMEFTDDYIQRVGHMLPELPGKRVMRYVREMGLREQDAVILTRDKEIADYFESTIRLIGQIGKIGQIGYQSVVNLIINKKIPIDLSVEEFVKKALDLLSPKETDEKALDTLINHLIKANQKAVEDYKKGKENAIMFLVGQVMREMRGKADASIVIEEIKKKLQ